MLMKKSITDILTHMNIISMVELDLIKIISIGGNKFLLALVSVSFRTSP